jgi:N-acetylglucosaminyl-diphospho-decaprenol L-rhamnosyltransferase
MTENNITIIITSFKSDNKIYNCLDSINKKYKIIVIENSKNSLVKKKLESKYPNLTCFIAGENLGYAKGNNLGLSKVKTTYALILNPDTIVHENAIENFFFKAKKIDNFAIIAPAAQDEKNHNNNSKNFIEVDTVKGFAMFLKLSEFNEVGFFDDNFFIYLEEIDLCRRLRKKNKKIFLDPEIIINHQGGSSHDEKYNFEMELSRNWHWMWSTFYYTKKYKGLFFAIILTSRKFISSILKYIFYLIIRNESKKCIYKQRMSGLLNAMIGKNSWYRPFRTKR